MHALRKSSCRRGDAEASISMQFDSSEEVPSTGLLVSLEHQHSPGDQLDAIPKRIENVTTPNPRKAFVFLSINSRGPQARSQLFVIVATQCRMRLLRSTKIFFHSKMKLHATARKPASPALRQLRRLGNFRHAEQIAIEPSRMFFSTRWHRQLHVVNRCKRRLSHAHMLTDKRKSQSAAC
jgi:hypothetical protein